VILLSSVKDHVGPKRTRKTSNCGRAKYNPRGFFSGLFAMSTTYCFFLPDISCVNCVEPIKEAIQPNNRWGIVSCYVNLLTKKITLIVKDEGKEPSAVRQLLHDFIEGLGLTCRDITPESENNRSSAEESSHKKSKKNSWLKSVRKFISSHWFLGAIGIGAGITLLVLSLIFTGGLPLAALIAIGATSSLLTLILGAPFYYNAVKKLVKARVITMDLLFTISTLTVIGVSIAAFFFPWLPMMFAAGLLIFGFRHLGIAIEDSLKLKIAGKNFQDRLPQEVEVIVDDSRSLLEKRSLAAIKVGEVLLLHAGEIIPVDGICLTGESLVYDTIEYGSVMPRLLRSGECVVAGMRLAEGAATIKLQAKSNAANSYLAKLDANIVQALSQRAPIEETAQKILQYFIPTVIGLALITGVVIGLLFPPALAIQCAVAVLLSACPCILWTIPSLAMNIGINKAVKNQVQFKSAEALQAAANIDIVVIDIHGTLTTGTLEGVYHSNKQDLIDAEDMLRCFAAIEQKYCDILAQRHPQLRTRGNLRPHPIAKAICAYVRQKIDSDVQLQVEKLDHSNHSGLIAEINGLTYVSGNKTMMEQQGIDMSTMQDRALRGGELVVYLACNKRLLGYIVLTDPLRKDAKQTIEVLKKQGKEVYICTGDDQDSAYRYARMLNFPIENVRAACVGMSTDGSDNSKTAFIASLQAKGHKVAMIGDGGNDTLAFVNSDFSIAMKSSTDDEMSQVKSLAVIQNDRLLPIANAFAIAKQTVANIQQNLFFSLSYNMAAVLIPSGLLLGLGFIINPVVGVILMIIQATLVLANAYRFKCQPLEHEQKSNLEDPPEIRQSYSHFCNQMEVRSIMSPHLELGNDAIGITYNCPVIPREGVDNVGSYSLF
jgi:P-type Cu2+ transporter